MKKCSNVKRYGINKTKYLLDDEALILEEVLHRYPGRDSLLIEIALSTGARASEVLSIKRSHLNECDETILIQGLKGSNDREIPIKKDLFRRLLLYSEGRDIIFDLSYNRFREIWLFYRPVPKKLHCLRHTFAIRLFKKTKDLRLVQLALGHRSIINTMVYADYVYSQTELKRLIL